MVTDGELGPLHPDPLGRGLLLPTLGFFRVLSLQIPDHTMRVLSREVPTLAPTCGVGRKISSCSASHLEVAL